MKKFYLSVLIVLILAQADAQYKKASFFNRTGTTNELTVSERFAKDSKTTFTGVSYGFGRDRSEHFFIWNELEFILPTTFSYDTYDHSSGTGKVNVSGKYSSGFLYRFNVGYYLANAKNEDAKFKPFITAGVNATLSLIKPKTIYYSPDQYTDPQKIAIDQGFNYGINAGLGGVYNFTQKIGLKVVAGYSYQRQANALISYDEYDYFTPFGSHPYVSVGVRFTKESDD
jgi:hypothetical protein